MIDPDNPPIGEPRQINAGSTYKWRRSLTNFLPANSWVLTYAFSDGATQQSITATDNSDGTHLATLTATVSGDLTPGDWEWHAYVTKSSERYDVGRGMFSVIPDISTNPGDIRSEAKRVLDAIRAVIANRATLDQESVTLEGRSLARTPVSDLLRLERVYRNRHRNEMAQQRKAMGLSSGTRQEYRFPPR